MTDAVAPQGRNWPGYALGFALLIGIVRIIILSVRRREALPATAFGWYLLGVGLVAVLAYVATRPAEDVVRRYLLLSLLIPVGLTGLWLALEPRHHIRHGVLVLVLGWAAFAGVDNWKQFDRYLSGEVPNPMGALANALETRGVSIAEAPYWRAYKLTFLTGERVKVASTDVVRITEYQKLAAAEGAGLMRIQEEPCAGGEQVGGWYLCGK